MALRIFLSLLIVAASVFQPPGLDDDLGAGICLGILALLWLAIFLNRWFVICSPKILIRLMMLLAAVSIGICVRRFTIHS